MTWDLQTDRLSLRQVSMADADELTALINDIEVSRWLTRVPYPYDADDAKDFISTAADTSIPRCAIHCDGAFIGMVTIDNQLGYWLGRPYWGHGYITEAARALVDAHFARGGGGIDSGYFVENAGSRGVLTKLGFVDTEIVDATSLATGETHKLQRMHLAGPEGGA